MAADRLEAESATDAGSSAASARPGGAATGTAGRRTLERLFGRLIPALARWAHGRLPRRARRRGDTMDLVQDACAGAIANLPDLDGRDPAQVDFYLRQSIRNRIRDEVRRARLGEIGSSEGLALPDPGPSPLEEVLESEQRRRYRRALLGLDSDDQQLVIGRVELKLRYEELARATGRTSAEAARCATRRAMLRLARALGELERRERPTTPAPEGCTPPP